MRLRTLCISGRPPIELFHATELSNRVVIAGPNGVGKTRLNQALISIFQSPNPDKGNFVELEATSQEEVDSWKKKTINTSDAQDCALLRQFLHINRLRKNLRSSLVHIESNRTISNIKPFAFTWEMADPDEEKIDWSLTFQPLNSRWSDTQHSIFRKIFAQRNSLGSEAIKLRRQGLSVMKLGFSDPLEPFRDAFESLLAPKKLVQPDLKNQRLLYELDGNPLTIDTLSSGEKQVVNIAFDIILRSPSDSIFVIDEPELHLHPELSFKLIRTLQNIGVNNQFVFFTHSADIISSSIDDTVLFMRPPDNGANQAIKAGKDDEATQGLKLLGHSIGVISLGRKIVLIEGEDSSVDKKVYSSILGKEFSEFVLLPVGSVQTLHNFENIRERVLDQSIWGVDFFMLCDHDAPYSQAIVDDDQGYPRLRRIARYHIENYFLEEKILAEVFSELETEIEWLRDPDRILAELKLLAAQKLSYAAALIVARTVWRQAGNVRLLPKACEGVSADTLVQLLTKLAGSEGERTAQILAPEKIEAMTRQVYSNLEQAINSDGQWKSLIPGKAIFKSFLAKAGIKDAHVKSLYLKKARGSPNDPFSEIVKVFEYFRSLR